MGAEAASLPTLAELDARRTALLQEQLALLEEAALLEYRRSRPTLAAQVLRGGPGAYAAFVRWAWHILEPGTLLRWGPHLDVLCDAIQRQIEGDRRYRRLLLVFPPGTGKSIVLAGCRTPYIWLTRGHSRSIYVSASDSLARRDSLRARNIIESTDYRDLLRQACALRGEQPWTLAHDRNQASDFENTQRGFRECMGIDSNVTGHRGDDLVLDDLMDAKEALKGTPDAVEARMASVSETIGAVLKTRVNDQRKATITLMMQRLHPHDPVGMAIRAGGWKTIVFPMEYDPDLPANCGGPCPEDWRTEPGQLLDPVRFPAEVVAELREPPPNGMGDVQFEGQCNAKPSFKLAEMYRSEWFTVVYDVDPRVMRDQMDMVIVVCDATFKKTGTSNCCIETWGRRGLNAFYLLDEVCRKMGYRETREELRRATAKWRPEAMVVEDKANGPALIDDLSEELPVPIERFDPGTKSKAEREEINSVPAFAAGNVHLPTAAHAPFVSDYVQEHLAGGTMNDRRDTTSMAIAYFRRGHSTGSSVLDAFSEQSRPTVLELVADADGADATGGAWGW